MRDQIEQRIIARPEWSSADVLIELRCKQGRHRSVLLAELLAKGMSNLYGYPTAARGVHAQAILGVHDKVNCYRQDQ